MASEETYRKAEAAARDRIAERIARHRNPELTGLPDIVVMPDEYAACYSLADALMPDLDDLIAEGRRQGAEEIAADLARRASRFAEANCHPKLFEGIRYSRSVAKLYAREARRGA